MAQRFKAPVLKFDAGRPFLYRLVSKRGLFQSLSGEIARSRHVWFLRVSAQLGPGPLLDFQTRSGRGRGRKLRVGQSALGTGVLRYYHRVALRVGLLSGTWPKLGPSDTPATPTSFRNRPGVHRGRLGLRPVYPTLALREAIRFDPSAPREGPPL